MPQLSTRFDTETFEAFLAERREPAWLTALRRRAWETFQELPLPDRSLEEWMRTDIRGFHLDQFALPGPSADGRALPRAVLGEGVALGGTATTCDSRFFSGQLDDQLARQGVVFGSLDAWMASQDDDLVERFRPYLFAAVDGSADKFAALHAACWSGGVVLYVPRGLVVEQPLHMLSALSPGGVDFGHVLIILDEGAEATVLAETASREAAAIGLHCGAIEIYLRPRARLRYVNLQDWGTGVWHFAHQHALVDRHATLQWTIGALGGRLAKVNQHVSLIGPHSETQVNGVMFTEGKQHLSYHTLQHHQAPACKSDLLYKGALQDTSRLVWRGMIKVDRDAQKTDGYQRDDNLLLSEDARADSIPGLEIQADDVKCSHGATAGCVDDELIFYAGCRGLNRQEAIRLIVTGFFQQVFDRVTIPSVRDALAAAVGRRIREYR